MIINAVYHLRIRGGGGGEEGELKRGEAKAVSSHKKGGLIREGGEFIEGLWSL